MIVVPRQPKCSTSILRLVQPFPPNFSSSNPKWFSPSFSSPQDPHHLISLLRREAPQPRPSLPFSPVSALKEAATANFPGSYGHQLHALALKLGLDQSNIYVRNGLINLYAKHGLLGDARLMFDSSPLLDSASWNIMLAAYVKSCLLDDALKLFGEMPVRDCVSFTTMIMGLSQNNCPAEALEVFWEMTSAGVVPNEVTLASVISACAHLCAASAGKAVHAVATRAGLDPFVLVSTNLVHMYAACSSLRDSEAVFREMPERNLVTWNVMLNGYCKSGLISSARDLFDRIPERDLVSWSTMIDGYLRADRLQEALFVYREMLQTAITRPNEVLIVDLVSACGRLSALREGQQFHALISKIGLDIYSFVQATVIHFYSVCLQIDHACLQFHLGRKDNISSWNALLVGYLRNDMLDLATTLFNEMPERDVVSWSTMIAGYAQSGQSDVALQLFQEMQAQGVQPNEITMVSILSAIANSGTLEQGRWMHSFITENSIPLNDNLSAGLVDMYAKCGSIRTALQVFYQVRDETASVSPWNAIICSLAMHGHADMALNIFKDLQKTMINPNSITFIGVMSACCHAGLLVTGKHHFESMKSVYGIEPNIKHYGCMVDLLGRSGRLEEARRLIESMPMKADVVIWGSMLAASRTHGDVEIGELAAENLARLEPDHGAGRVLLSNIYAEAGMWDDVFLVRRAMQGSRITKLPGCSGVV